MDYTLTSDKYIASQNEVLELAVKVVVHPLYGWITASLIIYGCRPKEVFSLIPHSNAEASVLDLNINSQTYKRRKVLAIPPDFVEKLNLFDQVCKPISFTSFKEFNEEEFNNIMKKWFEWFTKMEHKFKIEDFRDYWAFRSIKNGTPPRQAANSLGISLKDFNNRYYLKIKHK